MLRQIPRAFGAQNSRLYGIKVQASQTLDVPQPDLTPRLPERAPAPEISTSKLSNGVQVATWENFGPASSLTFSLNASSRFETAENLGVSHFLRLFGFRGTKGRTHLRLVRELDNQGINLFASANREQIAFTAEFLRDDLAKVVEIFSSYFTAPEFALHEVEEVRNRVGLDLAKLALDGDAKIVELLHKNAFRTGLGNSIYTPEVSLDAIDQSTIKNFAAKHFVGGNISVSGAGVNMHDLEHLLADHLHVSSGKVAATPSKYLGGESSLGRFDDINRVGVAYGTQGVENHFYAVSVLQKILGGSSAVKYGGSPSPLGQIAQSKADIDSFHFGYSDAGLIGFLIKSPEDVSSLVEQSVAQLKSLASNVSEADLARGKNAAKFEFAENWAVRSSISSNLSKQLLVTGKIFSTADYFSAIDKVSAEEIKKVADKLANSKPTIVAAADNF